MRLSLGVYDGRMNVERESLTLGRVHRRIRKLTECGTPAVGTVAELCVSCSNAFWRPVGRRKHLCPDCTASNVANAVESMEAKEGDAYERATVGQLAYWLGEAERQGMISAEQRRNLTCQLP